MATTHFACQADALHEARDYERVPGWDLHAVQTTPGAVEGWRREWQLDGVQLLDEQMGQVTVNVFGVAPPGTLTFGLLLAGEREVRVNGRRWGIDTAAVGPGGVPLELLTPPVRMVTLVVRRALLAEHLRLRDGLQLEDLDAGVTGMLVREPAVVTAARARIARVCRVAGGLPDAAHLSGPQALLLRDDLLDIAADILGTAWRQELAPLRRNVQMEVVHQARRHVALHRDHPLRVIDLCRATRVSRRSLQSSFTEVLGISPVGYLRLMRLDAARRRLLDADGPTQVQDVLGELGIWHASHFSAEYRTLFGERPSETLRRRMPSASHSLLQEFTP